VPTASRVFTDPAFPDAEFPVLFKPVIDIGSDSKRDELAQQFAAAHVTGDAEWVASEGQRGRPPSPVALPLPDGSVVMAPVTTSLCFLIATFMVAEEAAGSPKPWSFLEWVALSHQAPVAFREITGWLSGLRADAASAAKNAPRASGAPSSDSPCTDEPAITPSSSKGATT
jgi:hypothetical protein